MTHLKLLSDRPPRDHEAFLLNVMNGLEERKIRSVAVVAVLEEPLENGVDGVTAYCNMCLRDRQLAATLIQEDVSYMISRDTVRDLVDPDSLTEEED